MPSPLERRHSPRVAVGQHDHLPPSLRDVSLGGFCLELPEALPAESVHEFNLSVDPRQPVVVRARVVHSRRIGVAKGQARYLTGLAFIAEVSGRARRKAS